MAPGAKKSAITVQTSLCHRTRDHLPSPGEAAMHDCAFNRPGGRRAEQSLSGYSFKSSGSRSLGKGSGSTVRRQQREGISRFNRPFACRAGILHHRGPSREVACYVGSDQAADSQANSETDVRFRNSHAAPDRGKFSLPFSALQTRFSESLPAECKLSLRPTDPVDRRAVEED